MKHYTGNFDTPINSLTKGERFFHAGMWYDFESIQDMGGYLKISVTNGYDDRLFDLIARRTDKVVLSRSAITNRSINCPVS